MAIQAEGKKRLAIIVGLIALILIAGVVTVAMGVGAFFVPAIMDIEDRTSDASAPLCL